jgi:hypothetical protein
MAAVAEIHIIPVVAVAVMLLQEALVDTTLKAVPAQQPLLTIVGLAGNHLYITMQQTKFF